jgi:hypothetical protein
MTEIIPPNAVPAGVAPIQSVQQTVHAQSVSISPHQAWSAAVQNIVIAMCVTVPWVMGRIDAAVALPVLLGLSGLDLVGRFRAKNSTSGALSYGSTGALSSVSKFPGVSVVLVGALTALGLATGCVGQVDHYRTTAQSVVDNALPVAKAISAQCAIDRELSDVCLTALTVESTLRQADAVLAQSTATEAALRAAYDAVLSAVDRLVAAIGDAD